MLRIRIELCSAITGETTEIGRMNIANTGSCDDPNVGDYSVQVLRKGSKWPNGWARPEGGWVRASGVAREGSVSNYPRLSYNVWRPVIRALLSAFPEEKRG